MTKISNVLSYEKICTLSNDGRCYNCGDGTGEGASYALAGH
jgi:hypothetical protein